MHVCFSSLKVTASHDCLLDQPHKRLFLVSEFSYSFNSSALFKDLFHHYSSLIYPALFKIDSDFYFTSNAFTDI